MQTTVLNIENLDNEDCADFVADALIKIGGVRDVRVSLLDSKANVEFDEAYTSPHQLASVLERAGYPSLAEIPESRARAGGCCGGCCGG